ncbi:MAG: hypothetical protein V7767_01835 [Leeuwenhoekiella sp.]
MGIFSAKSLTESQINKLNEILPDGFQKSEWYDNDFKVPNSIYLKVENLYNATKNSYIESKKEFDKITLEFEEIEIKNITIFNTEIYQAEPLGMVDIGCVEKFGAASTGDRFSNGAIGYAIESAIDSTWTKGNLQENAVNNVKFKLLQKAKSIYPDCNLLFKYEVDFREIGSSGNVFIYMRGTATKGVNKTIATVLEKAENEISILRDELETKKAKVEELQIIKSKVPQTFKDVVPFLGE